MSTEAQAPAPAAKPRRHVPELTLLHSQELDLWAVTLARTALGDDDDDDEVPVYFFSSKEKAEAYIGMMSPTDDDDDDEPDPEVVAELEKLFEQETQR
jgi:hypothetical protein